MNKLRSLKYFKEQAKKAEVGKLYRIKSCTVWEVNIGWHSHYSFEVEFIELQGHTAIFYNRFGGHKVHIPYSEIKTGKSQIIWEPESIFSVVTPTVRGDVKKLHEPGMIYPHK